MIDLQKPLAIYTIHNQLHVNVTFRFQSKAGKIVVETEHGSIYVFNQNGKIVDSVITTYTLKNVVPDWKKAYDQYCIEEAEDRTEEYIFQRGFEAGRNWK